VAIQTVFSKEEEEGEEEAKFLPMLLFTSLKIFNRYPSGVTMPHHGYGAINDENVHKRGVYYNASGCIISHMGDNYIRML